MRSGDAGPARPARPADRSATRRTTTRPTTGRPAPNRPTPARPGPNRELRALLAESGWTQEAFARAVGRLGAEAGVPLRYDRTSVAHWLRGSRPAPRVQALVAEALSRRLGRPVAVPELGMGDGRSGGPGPRTAARPHDGPARAVHAWDRAAASACPGTEATRSADQLAALTAAVVGPPRAEPLPPAPYRLTLLTGRATGTARAAAPAGPGPGPLPGRGSDPVPAPAACAGPTGSAEPPRARPPLGAFAGHPGAGRPPHRTTPGEVASLREHVRFFAQQADRHGGGHIRTPLAASLSALVRQLRAGGAGPHHAQLLGGAARLSFLLARVYVDEQRHGLAQRAFLTAAGLAAEGADPEGVALARRALGSQAHELGHRRQALSLAESACALAPGGTAPSTRAFLHAGLAVARASAGERTGALDALSRAERELARVPADLTTGPGSPGGEPVGCYQDAALLYQSSRVRRALGDRAGAVRDLRASVLARPAGERRTRALSHAELAELLLAVGRLEEACAAWQVFLEDCALVRSGRARRARDRMPRLLRPYAAEESVQLLLDRAGLRPYAP